MIFDIATRHQLALDPSSLTSITLTLTAIARAIEDARNAGVAPDSDPAVVLLTRHLARISPNRAPRAILQAACTRKLEMAARFPALLTLASQGVEYDSIAKDRFHSEGTALAKLAEAFHFRPGEFTITSTFGERSESGRIRLVTPWFTIVLRVGAAHRGRELLTRAVRDGGEIAHNHYAPIRALLRTDAFTAQLREDLGLPATADRTMLVDAR